MKLNLSPIFSYIQKFSLIDYKDKISMVFFTKGCNFKCPYCHNPDLVINNPKTLPTQEINNLLRIKKNVIEGIVICGGEPTIHKNLIDWIKYIRSFGYSIKLDSNGTNPKIIKTLIQEKLIDFFAIDYKNQFKKYNNISKTGLNLSKIKETINLVVNSGIKYEIRTTIHYKFHNYDDLKAILYELKKLNVENYALQKFVKRDNHIEDLEDSYKNKELIQFGNTIFKKHFANFEIRN